MCESMFSIQNTFQGFLFLGLASLPLGGDVQRFHANQFFPFLFDDLKV